MHSFIIQAICLLLTLNASARVPHSFRDVATREPEPEIGILGWLNRFFKREIGIRQDSGVCYLDQYYDFVYNSSFGEAVCQALITYPNTTTTVDYTPISTERTIVTTQTQTVGEVERTIPVTTVTVTVSNTAVTKRDAQVTSMARNVPDSKLHEFFNIYRRQAAAANSSVPNDNTLSASLSSACSCQTYGGPIVTDTYTNQAAVRTINGFTQTTLTSTTTRTAGLSTATVTVVASPAPSTNTVSVSPPMGTAPAEESSFYVQTTGVSQGTPSFPSEEPTSPVGATLTSSPSSLEIPPTSSTSSTPAIPTAPPFTCPADDGDTVSQMINNERYDYIVFCDADLVSDPDLLSGLTYNTFPECVAACSMIDGGFDQPICQGVVYFDTPSTDGGNCLLKSSAGNTTFASGVNVAVLQRIAVGIDAADPSGTATESAPFSGETTSIAPSDMSSAISSIMGTNTTSMSMITPGPAPVISGRPAVDGITYYSTYVSAGTTFSTGSVFSTYHSENGSWYYSYYTTFSQAWTSATTYYGGGSGSGSGSGGAGAQASAVPVGTNTTSSSQEGLEGGGYSITSNTTTDKIIYGNGYTIHNVTVVSGTDAYNASGTEMYATTTTYYYSYTETGVSSDSGGSGGAGGGAGGSGSGIASVSASTSTEISTYFTQTIIYNSGATSGGSGFFASGAVQTPAPAITSTSVFSTQIVVTNAGATQGGSGGEGSGSVESTAMPIVGGSSVVVNTYSTAYGSGYAVSGVNSANATARASSTAASGLITPGFSNSNAPRSGTDSTTLPVAISVITFPYGTGSVVVNTYSTVSGSGYAISGIISPNATSRVASGSGAGFTNSGAPRSGTESSSSTVPAFTSPRPYGPYVPLTSTSSLSSNSPSNMTAPMLTGTGSVPLSTGPSAGFSNSGDNRSGTLSLGTSPGTAPIPTGTGSVPLSTGTAPGFSNTGDNRSGTYSGPSATGTAPLSARTGSIPLSTGTAPLGTAPPGTAPLGTAPLDAAPLGTAPLGTGSIPLSTGTAPMMLSTGTAPIGTAPLLTSTPSFSKSGAPRSGTDSTIPTSPPSSSGVYGSVSTTTEYITTTFYGCYGNCAPGGFGGPYGPQSFGPPVFRAPPGGLSTAATTTA